MEFKKVLEEALGMTQREKYSQDDLIAFVRKRMDDIQNPHKALEAELADLVSKKTPPGGELYRDRLDKTELAVAFFRRVYGRFHEAELLYKHQLRLMDAVLLNNLGHHTAEIQLRPKKDFNTAIASKVLGSGDYAKSAVLSVLNRKYAGRA